MTPTATESLPSLEVVTTQGLSDEPLVLPVAPPWRVQSAPLTTPWAQHVSPERVLPEYPRPQLVRPRWLNLNGLWHFAPAQADDDLPFGPDLAESILVPFPVEAALSGIMRHE